jgi:prefoldin subunit 5
MVKKTTSTGSGSGGSVKHRLDAHTEAIDTLIANQANQTKIFQQALVEVRADADKVLRKVRETSDLVAKTKQPRLTPEEAIMRWDNSPELRKLAATVAGFDARLRKLEQLAVIQSEIRKLKATVSEVEKAHPPTLMELDALFRCDRSITRLEPTIGEWHYESDGEPGVRTHYAVRIHSGMPCGVERCEFPSRAVAEKFLVDNKGKL